MSAWPEAEYIIDEIKNTFFGSGTFYFKKGTSVDFTDVIKSMGRKPEDFSTDNFRVIIDMNKPITGAIYPIGMADGNHGAIPMSVTISLLYNNGIISSKKTSVMGDSGTIWNPTGNDYKAFYAKGRIEEENIIIEGYVFDPSPKPFES